MTTAELFAMPPDTAGVDRWLLSGRLIERWNGSGFHSPGHAGAVAAVSSLLSQWCHEHGRGLFRAFGYGCPYRLRRDPDTVASFDASVLGVSEKTKIDPEATHIDGPPVLAVEVVELDEGSDLLRVLVDESPKCGVRSVWVIDPFETLVVCYSQDGKPVYVNGGMDLVGGPYLPGFRCRVAEVFE